MVIIPEQFTEPSSSSSTTFYIPFLIIKGEVAFILCLCILYRCLYLSGAATLGLWLQPWRVFGIAFTFSFNFVLQGAFYLVWDDAETGRMVESENHSPQQPPQATSTGVLRV
ncbi:hypothetical protein Tco_1444432 [Tanacetum coccineum]